MEAFLLANQRRATIALASIIALGATSAEAAGGQDEKLLRDGVYLHGAFLVVYHRNGRLANLQRYGAGFCLQEETAFLRLISFPLSYFFNLSFVSLCVCVMGYV